MRSGNRHQIPDPDQPPNSIDCLLSPKAKTIIKFTKIHNISSDHVDCQKNQSTNERQQVRQKDTHPPYAGALPRGGVDALPRDLHFYNALVELMLNSN